MKLLFEDAADHYLEDPDNEDRIKKSEIDAIKKADKPLPRIKPPKYKWEIFPGGSTYPVYLNRLNSKLIYVKDYDDAPEMTEAEAKKAATRFERKFGLARGPYKVTNVR